jgi:flagellin
MARINSNVPSLVAQANLARTNQSLESTLGRLSTGLRISRGADDPAGLIVSERLRSNIRGIEQGIRNSERASNVIATTEGALTEVSELLNSIKALVVESANTGAFSREEIEANQLQIDSAIDSITRISNTASFGELQLLNGSLAYSLSNVAAADLNKVQVFGAAFGNRASIDVDVEILGSAQTANLFFRTDFADQGIGGATNGQLVSSVTLEVAGPQGVIELTFISGAANSDIINAINARSSITGVTATSGGTDEGSPASGIVLSSEQYGSEAFVSVTRLSGGESLISGRIANNGPGPIDGLGGGANSVAADEDEGKDVLVLLNGAVATGRGLQVNSRNPDLDLSVLLDETFATTEGSTSTFQITGGGSLYQLGPNVTPNQQVNIGMFSIAATRLGATLNPQTDGSLSMEFLSTLKSGGANEMVSGNLANASRVLETAIEEISSLRGRLGSFERNTLDTNIRSLQASLENITASESVIRDADFAFETAELSRLQVLQAAGTSVLATANQNPQQVLQLLG